MTINYIIEICVAINIAILGIAYPIIVSKISNIGDRYSSEYIPVVFENEFPQKAYKLTFRTSVFKLTLFTTLFSFVFLIFKIAPPFGWDNLFLNNSAEFTVFILTALLIIFFFIWLRKVALYNGKSKSLLTHLINNYKKSKIDTEIQNYHLKAINELAFYAIEKQDEHLQETLLEFYYSVFTNARKQYNKTEPIIYPIDLYFLVSKLNEIVIEKETKLKDIEHRAISGVWLLGQGYEDNTISKETYKWLWRNIYTICNNPRLVKMFWANSNQYFEYKWIQPSLIKTAKQEQSVKTDTEKDSFLEFHYALGGLLLYQKQYKTLRYLFKYSQSHPPEYVLLPETMTEIFYWFEYFNNEFKHISLPIDLKYLFPELDNLGNRRQVNYWICSYITILFLRQYTLHQYYVYQDFTALPNLSDDIFELSSWLDSVPFFERCLNNVLSNKDLIKDLKFEKLVEEKKDAFPLFICELKKSIKYEIKKKNLNSKLSDDKIQKFLDKSKKIISEAFEVYKPIFNEKGHEHSESKLKLSIIGEATLVAKSAFVDNDTIDLNYSTFLAKTIVENKIKRYIPNSFLVAKTKRYLLNKDNILIALSKIIGKVNDIIIIGVRVSPQLKEILNGSSFKNNIKYIPSTGRHSQDTLFVLRKNDLPAIEHKDRKTEEITELQLECINKNLKLYASVIDINTAKNKKIKDKLKIETELGKGDLKVLLSIAFSSIIYWRNEREVIQINIASEYREQGIQNDIKDVKPLLKLKN